MLADLAKEDRQFQVAQLENCLGDDALKTLEGFKFDTPDDERTVKQILDAFETYAIGEVNETLERFKFGKRQQAEGEAVDKFIADLRILMKTCHYCDECSPSILRDRIVLGILNDETREDLLKERQLTVEKCIDICKASESAICHKASLTVDTVNRVKETTSGTGGIRECRFCPYKHIMRKENCPAWGKVCKKCGKKNHDELKCLSRPSGTTPAVKKYQKKKGRRGKDEQLNYMVDDSADSSDYEHCNVVSAKRFGKKHEGCKRRGRKDTDEQLNYMVENTCSDFSDYEWCNAVSAEQSGKKREVCKMIVEGQEIAFMIDTGATINTINSKMLTLSRPLQPYNGSVRMWNKSEDKPVGCCRLKVVNPKNGKKYVVPFVVFDSDRMPLLSKQTSIQMNLVKLQTENYEVAAVNTDTFSDVFDGGLGTLPGEQTLRIKEDAQPVIMANRRVPIALRPKLKAELEKLTRMGVITKVDGPTPWVSQIVITHKKSGEIRICLDPHELNKVILREHYTLPILEDVLHELRSSHVFSKADLSSGYWHVRLDEESSFLTTFQSAFGRYRYLRLPFGISGASEYFQKRLIVALEGLPGVVCIADDVVIHGRDQQEHDQRLQAFLARCQKMGIKLNQDKLDVGVKSLTFMGHQISENGLQPDPQKVSAILQMRAPEDLPELRRFVGMVNYLAKFLPNITTLMQPLNNLLKKDVSWNWSTSQQDAFEQVKKRITEAPVLAYYDPDKPLVLENDASEYGLGCALLQEGRPIAYASRSLSATERRYAQIEKEMLALTYSLEKFHHYTLAGRCRL